MYRKTVNNIVQLTLEFIADNCCYINCWNIVLRHMGLMSYRSLIENKDFLYTPNIYLVPLWPLKRRVPAGITAKVHAQADYRHY